MQQSSTPLTLRKPRTYLLTYSDKEVTVKKIKIAEVNLDGFDKVSVLESMADFESQDVMEGRFILFIKTVVMMSEDSDLTGDDQRFLKEVLKTKAHWYVFSR